MIDAAVIDDLPATPPTYFERRINEDGTDIWRGGGSTALRVMIARGFQEDWTSSSGTGTLKNISRMWLDAPALTSSHTDIIEFLADLLSAEKRADSVNEASVSENLFELRRLTGFTWERLADLLNVEPRTLNNWVEGSEIQGCNHEHIAKTLSVMRFADRGSAEENAVALGKRTMERSPFAAIKARRYLNARRYMGHGIARQGLSLSASDWIGEYAPLATHEAADGAEASGALPDEAETAGRDRRIQRD